MAGSQFCLTGSNCLRDGSVFVRAFQIEALPIKPTSLVRGFSPKRGISFRTIRVSVLIASVFVLIATYNILTTKILVEKRKLSPFRTDLSLTGRVLVPVGRCVVLAARIPFLPRGLSPLHADYLRAARILALPG
jgi:hypothetical protein